MNNMNDKYDYGYNYNTQSEKHPHSDGHYNQKAYNPTIKVVCEYEHITLRTVETSKIAYEILWEGEVLNRYSTLKIAESFFMDFTGMTKAKYNKMKKA